MNGLDAVIYTLRRRPGRRRPYEVRWRAAGRVRSRSLSTRALADSYRAELVRAARTATPLARRPYDLHHAALYLWLNAGGEPAQIAARAGNSTHVLLTVYTNCIHSHDQHVNQHITTALTPQPWHHQ